MDTSKDDIGLVAAQQRAVAERSLARQRILESQEYQAQLALLRAVVRDLAVSMRLCEVAASRREQFREHYLLPVYMDDILEAAITAQLAVENGALNPARRELRYMLEVTVNVAFVDEICGSSNFDERVDVYRSSRVKKSNVDHVQDLPLRMLSCRDEFRSAVLEAWVRASNYVHLTKQRMDEKLRLRAEGHALGFETVEMLAELVDDIHRACSIVMALSFETIGPGFAGDLLVGGLDARDDWSFHANGYIAEIDSYFDYKNERRNTLASYKRLRASRVRYPVASADA